jgi:hypothetical protein
LPVSIKASKPKKEQALSNKAIKKAKTVEKKAEIAVAQKKPKLDKTAKTVEKKVIKKPEQKIKAFIPETSSKAIKKIKAVEKKVEIVVPAITSKPSKKVTVGEKKAEKKTEKKIEKKIEIVVPALTRKSNKKTEIIGNKAQKVVSATNQKTVKKDKIAAKKVEKKTERKVEIVIPPMVEKAIKKKIKPIGSAVVRGRTGRYDFEVFPLDADLKDGSAIYVISKRITDKRGRGHHKFVCIGQTESLVGEIKKHKKDKCIKQHNANVICLLREESATNRLKIETDLREAHAIACNQK